MSEETRYRGVKKRDANSPKEIHFNDTPTKTMGRIYDQEDTAQRGEERLKNGRNPKKGRGSGKGKETPFQVGRDPVDFVEKVFEHENTAGALQRGNESGRSITQSPLNRGGSGNLGLSDERYFPQFTPAQIQERKGRQKGENARMSDMLMRQYVNPETGVMDNVAMDLRKGGDGDLRPQQQTPFTVGGMGGQMSEQNFQREAMKRYMTQKLGMSSEYMDESGGARLMQEDFTPEAQRQGRRVGSLAYQDQQNLGQATPPQFSFGNGQAATVEDFQKLAPLIAQATGRPDMYPEPEYANEAAPMYGAGGGTVEGPGMGSGEGQLMTMPKVPGGPMDPGGFLDLAGQGRQWMDDLGQLYGHGNIQPYLEHTGINALADNTVGKAMNYGGDAMSALNHFLRMIMNPGAREQNMASSPGENMVTPEMSGAEGGGDVQQYLEMLQSPGAWEMGVHGAQGPMEGQGQLEPQPVQMEPTAEAPQTPFQLPGRGMPPGRQQQVSQLRTKIWRLKGMPQTPDVQLQIAQLENQAKQLESSVSL